MLDVEIARNARGQAGGRSRQPSMPQAMDEPSLTAVEADVGEMLRACNGPVITHTALHDRIGKYRTRRNEDPAAAFGRREAVLQAATDLRLGDIRAGRRHPEFHKAQQSPAFARVAALACGSSELSSSSVADNGWRRAASKRPAAGEKALRRPVAPSLRLRTVASSVTSHQVRAADAGAVESVSGMG